MTAPPASAANPCRQSGGTWWCNNVPGAAVYKNPYTFEVVGHMYSTPWFKCSYHFGANMGGPHPTAGSGPRPTTAPGAA